MNKFIKPLCAVLSLTLLCSCTRQDAKPEPKVSETETKTESVTRFEEPETSVSPEPMGKNDKKSHSYGVAQNGVANEISINAQKYFETNNCLSKKWKDNFARRGCVGVKWSPFVKLRCDL